MSVYAYVKCMLYMAHGYTTKYDAHRVYGSLVSKTTLKNVLSLKKFVGCPRRQKYFNTHFSYENIQQWIFAELQ